MAVDNEKNHLKKGTGYHLDLFIIGVLSAMAGLMGIPWMCAAPVRTVSHIGSLTVLTGSLAPGVKPKLDHIKDQRVTNFAVSLLIGMYIFNICDKSPQKVPYVYFDHFEIFAEFKRVSNKLSDDTYVFENWILTSEDIRKRFYFLLFSLYFTGYFAKLSPNKTYRHKVHIL